MCVCERERERGFYDTNLMFGNMCAILCALLSSKPAVFQALWGATEREAENRCCGVCDLGFLGHSQAELWNSFGTKGASFTKPPLDEWQVALTGLWNVIS